MVLDYPKVGSIFYVDMKSHILEVKIIFHDKINNRYTVRTRGGYDNEIIEFSTHTVTIASDWTYSRFLGIWYEEI